MPNQTADPSPEQSEPSETQLFPVIPFPLIIYPGIMFRFAPFLNPDDQKKWEEISGRDNPRAIALFRKPVLDSSGKKPTANKIGVLASIKPIDKENFKLTGISRVEILQFIADKKTNLLTAKVRMLEDKPKQSEISQSDRTIVFGSLEAALSLLIQLSKLLPEKEKLKDDVNSLIDYISNNRRDLNTAYYHLPCSILRDLDFIEDELLDALFTNDDVNYRLQAIIDILKREVKVFEMRQILFEDPESFRNGDMGK